jgi:hypothetical protein
MLLSVAQSREEPACLAHDLLQGPPAGIGEVAIRVAHHLCVPKTPSTSCDQAIFVDRAAVESLSSDAVLLYFDWSG